MIYSKTIFTPIGAMEAFSAVQGISLLEFCDNPMIESAKEKLKEDFGWEIVAQSNRMIDLLEGQLKEYFEGRRKSFAVVLNPAGTEFQQKVWNNLLNLEYGKTITYKEQARGLGNLKALRAVAAANGANKIPIVIPCHRVVGSNGELTGFSGGLWRKKFLLNLENPQQRIQWF